MASSPGSGLTLIFDSQVDEILRLSEFNEHQLSSFHELDDSCIHISRLVKQAFPLQIPRDGCSHKALWHAPRRRVPNIVNDEEMQCLLRNYNVVKVRSNAPLGTTVLVCGT
eukprot:scaffold7099_cov281-Pinguiococcus_pyrenoidosus.AAC.18